MEFKYEYGLKVQLLLWLNCCVTLFCYFLVFLIESTKLRKMKFSNQISSRATLASSGILSRIILKQLLILSLHPYPFFLGKTNHQNLRQLFQPSLIGMKFKIKDKHFPTPLTYHFNDILQLLSLLRIAYFSRLLIVLSRWRSSSARRIT